MALLREEEEAVVRQTQEGAAHQDSLQQVVQFPQPRDLFLQIHLGAQIIGLQ